MWWYPSGYDYQPTNSIIHMKTDIANGEGGDVENEEDNDSEEANEEEAEESEADLPRD